MVYLQENYVFLITLIFSIYEVVIRFYPTFKNNSIIDFVLSIFRLLVPNKQVDSKGQKMNDFK